MDKKAAEKIILDYQHDPKFHQLLKKFRNQGKKIVLTQGSFDMIHIGHGRYLEEAKSCGDILIVGVDEDQKIKHRKGDDRPIVPQEERLEMLTYLRSVDLVVLKKLDDPKWKLIKTIKPDTLIATKKTYTLDKIKKLHQYCGQVVVLDPMATTSTSAKIRLVQIGTAKKIEKTLTKKLINSIEEVLEDFRNNA